jgi:hypothetical protein
MLKKLLFIFIATLLSVVSKTVFAQQRTDTLQPGKVLNVLLPIE